MMPNITPTPARPSDSARSADRVRVLYEEELRPVLARLEVKRKNLARKMILLGAGAGVLALLVMLATRTLLSPNAFFVLILGGVVGSFAFRHLSKDYRNQFKMLLVPKLLGLLGDELRYQPDEGISQMAFQKSRLFQRSIDRYRSEDMIHGTHDGVPFHCSEVHAEYKSTSTNSKGRSSTTWHTIFRGLFLIAEFKRDFQGATFVLPNRTPGFLEGLAGRFSGRGEPVRLEDPEFNRRFDTYSDDQVTARYILTTSFMERLTAFANKHAQPAQVAFIDGTIYVAVSSSKDLLEPPLFKPLVDREIVRECLEDVELMLGIMDDLNLNERLWSRI